MSNAAPALRVRGLRVELRSGADVVDEIDLDIAPGEVLGLVGESGSGKTTVGHALLGHCRPGARIAAGRISVGERDLLGLSTTELRRVRGGQVAYIPQDPSAALNPARRIGAQLEELLRIHRPEVEESQRRDRAIEVLSEVALPADAAFLRRYPHELSGGQQQRVCIAMAFAPRPAVIIADEPTTGLDVTTQARVLETIRGLSRSTGVALLYVSHDLAVVSSIATRVAVMYAGRIVELAGHEQLFGRPRHAYTMGLLQAAPHAQGDRELVGIPGRAPLPGRRPAGCAFAERCPLAIDVCRREFPAVAESEPGHVVRCHRARDVASLASRGDAVVRAPTGPSVLLSIRALRASHGATEVVHGVDLDVHEGECLALVGESGSGKTTLARCIVGLHSSYDGTVALRGTPLAREPRRRGFEVRRQIQYIFQSPYGSLNPRRTVGQALTRQIELFADTRRADARRRAVEQLERVALGPDVAERYPDELSGGERQRVAIARALAADPQLLICDEITSALDVSVQAAIIDLLEDLRRSDGLSLLFVTHNLALIRTISDRVAVMSDGHIVETGPLRSVFGSPQADYTRRLIADTPAIEIVPEGSRELSRGK